MPRLTRNSMETSASNDIASTSSARPPSSTSSPVTSTHVSAMQTSNAGSLPVANIVNDVVQALQGSLEGLVQSAIDARLSVSSTAAVANNAGQSSSRPANNLAENAPTDNLESQTANYQTVHPADGMVSGVNAHLSDARGRLVPSFINTFATPSTSLVWSGNSSSSPSLALATGSVPYYCNPNASSGISLPQSSGFSSFIVGPGYAPIPAKTVGAITAGKYINLADLLPENSYAVDESNEPHLLLDGRLVLTGMIKKPRKEIVDIVSWVEAFSIYTLIVCTSIPRRWRDLTTYKLLILRTYRQFQSTAWLTYDKAFRQHAAALNLTDWSELNVFYTAGSAAKPSHSIPQPRVDRVSEGQGNSAAFVVCASWNRGRCVAPTALCRFRHACSNCSADHRGINCPTSGKAPSYPIPPKSRRF